VTLSFDVDVVVVTRNCLLTLVLWNTPQCIMTARDGRLARQMWSTCPLLMLSKQWSSTTMCRWMVSALIYM